MDPRWMHTEPFALAMAAAWGARYRAQGLEISLKNLTPRAKYAARMKLFEHLGVDPGFVIQEHEEAGRFVPIRNVRTTADIRSVIADVSVLLHLDNDQEALAAVQYCVSELLRNVLEHSNSPDGGFVCAHFYAKSSPRRVSIGIADCGQGIAAHLATTYPDVRGDDEQALALAMLPGITGARPGLYGTSENAGAGLFITRCIAKGSGGYFFLMSGGAAYRLRRSRTAKILVDPLEENHDLWHARSSWQGTVVSMEIPIDHIADFQEYFTLISDQIPRPDRKHRKIQFT
jgi:anti-sigma regulatory factor (Ser/Thr protein kinase)